MHRRGSSPDSIVPMGYAAYALEERLRQDHVESLQEYAALQDLLLKRTQRAGTFLAGYLLLTVSGKVQPPVVSLRPPALKDYRQAHV